MHLSPQHRLVIQYIYVYSLMSRYIYTAYISNIIYSTVHAYSLVSQKHPSVILCFVDMLAVDRFL
jgi:hypothetical protein